MSLARATGATGALNVRAVLKRRVLSLFREMCRETPRMIALYELEHTPEEMRRVINLLFKRHAGISDPRLIELQIFRGEQEMEETLKQYKQRGHVIDMLNLDKYMGSPAQGVSQLDNQAWLARICDILGVDKPRAEQLHRAARAEELGEVPGEALAPALGEETDRYFATARSGHAAHVDRFLLGTEEDAAPSASTQPNASNLPSELLAMRERAQQRAPSAEENREGLERVALDAEVGAGPWVRPPADVANSGLPLWIASKVHWPWVPASQDATDPRVEAQHGDLVDGLVAQYGSVDGLREAVGQQVDRAVAADPLRYGRGV